MENKERFLSRSLCLLSHINYALKPNQKENLLCSSKALAPKDSEPARFPLNETAARLALPGIFQDQVLEEHWGEWRCCLGQTFLSSLFFLLKDKGNLFLSASYILIFFLSRSRNTQRVETDVTFELFQSAAAL